MLERVPGIVDCQFNNNNNDKKNLVRVPCSLSSSSSSSNGNGVVSLREAGDWESFTDPHTGRVFYCHKVKKHCTWMTNGEPALPLCTPAHLKISYTRCVLG